MQRNVRPLVKGGNEQIVTIRNQRPLSSSYIIEKIGESRAINNSNETARIVPIKKVHLRNAQIR